MNTHPAYIRRSASNCVNGMIASIWRLTSETYLLRIMTSNGTCRALLADGQLPMPVSRGQAWQFSGKDVFQPDHGELFRIENGKRVLPSGQMIVPFLRYHVPELGMMGVKRWWQAFGDDLTERLRQADLGALAEKYRGAFGPTAARLAVEFWGALQLEMLVVSHLYWSGLNESVIQSVAYHYGRDSEAKLAADPYRLLAFANFACVDKAATRNFAIARDDPRRLLGAVEAVIHDRIEAGIHFLNCAEMLEAIKEIACLDEVEARRAILFALEKGRLFHLDASLFVSENLHLAEAIVARWILRSTPDRRSREIEQSFTRTYQTSFPLIPWILKHRLSIVVASLNRITNCLRSVSDHLSGVTEEIQFVAGSSSLAQRLKTATGLRVRGLADFLSGNRDERPPSVHTIVLVSATVDFPALAGLVSHSKKVARIVIMGNPLEWSGERALALPALLSVVDIPRMTLSDERPNLGATKYLHRLARLESSNWSLYPFSPRSASDHGIFCIRLYQEDLAAVVIGVSFQLLRLGDLSVITHGRRSREDLKLALKRTEGLELCPFIRVADANEIEPCDSDSSLIIAMNPAARDVSWMRTAVSSARSRAILLISFEHSDARCSTLGTSGAGWETFPLRWHHYTSHGTAVSRRDGHEL